MVRYHGMISRNKSVYYNYGEAITKEGCIESVQLDQTIGFAYKGVDCEFSDDPTNARGMVSLYEALNEIPVGYVLSFVRRNRKEYRPILDKHLKHVRQEGELEKAEVAFTKEQYSHCRAIEQYMFMTSAKQVTPNGTVDPYALFNPFKRTAKLTKDSYDTQKRNLEAVAHTFVSKSGKDGFTYKRMTTQDLWAYGYYHRNQKDPTTPLNESPFYQEDENGDIYQNQKSYREQLADTDIHQDGCLCINGVYIQVLSIDVPAYVSDGLWIEQLDAYLEGDYEVLVQIQRMDAKIITDRVMKNKRSILAKNTQSKEKVDAQTAQGMTQKILNPRIKTAAEILDNDAITLSDMSGLHANPCEVSILITIKDQDKEVVEKRTKEVSEVLRSATFNRMFTQYQEAYQVDQYHAFIPGNYHLTFSSYISHILCATMTIPLHEPYKAFDAWDDTKPSNLLYINTRNEIVKYHTYYGVIEPRHADSVGASGSGKTFDKNKITWSVLRDQTPNILKGQVINIEPKGGFEKLCRFLEGEYVRYDLNSTDSYNPFYAKKDVFMQKEDGKVGYDSHLLLFYANLFEKMLKQESRKSLDKRFRRYFFDAIKYHYDRVTDQDEIPILSDFIDSLNCFVSDASADIVASDRDDLAKMIADLEYWNSEDYINLFGRREQMDLNKPFVVFDLGTIRDAEDVKEVAYFLVSAAKFRACRREGVYTYAITDEASEVFRTGYLAEIARYELALSRSLGIVADFGSQNPSDSLNSPMGDTLNNNTVVTTAGFLNSNHDDMAVKGFNPYGIERMKALKPVQSDYAEMVRIINGKTMHLKSLSNPYLYWICTNNKFDDELIREYRNKYPNYTEEQLLIGLAKEYPNGSTHRI